MLHWIIIVTMLGREREEDVQRRHRITRDEIERASIFPNSIQQGHHIAFHNEVMFPSSDLWTLSLIMSYEGVGAYM